MALRSLHIVSGLDPRSGGVVNALEGLTTALAETGTEIEIVAPFREGYDTSVEERLTQRGITVTCVGPVMTPLWWHPKLKATVRQAVARADAVHIHGLWEEVHHQAARACQASNTPYIFSPHGMLDPWSLSQSAMRKNLYLKWRLRKNLNNASLIHCCSQIEGELLKPLRLKPKQLVEPNGLDFSEFDPLPEKGRFLSRHPELKGKRVLLFLSRLHHKKGLDLLIPAFAQAKQEDAVLVLAGPCDPAYKTQLEQMIQQAGLDKGQVIFAGMLHGQERIEAFVDADLFVLPSYQENFGIVVAESLAAGTPVLISDQVNIWPEIKDAGVGLICQTNIESIAQTLQASRDASQSITPDDCINMAKERYDWRAIAKRWAHHLEVLTCGSH